MRRTTISGAVSLPVIPDIISLRRRLSTMSTMRPFNSRGGGLTKQAPGPLGPVVPPVAVPDIRSTGPAPWDGGNPRPLRAGISRGKGYEENRRKPRPVLQAPSHPVGRSWPVAPGQGMVRRARSTSRYWFITACRGATLRDASNGHGPAGRRRRPATGPGATQLETNPYGGRLAGDGSGNKTGSLRRTGVSHPAPSLLGSPRRGASRGGGVPDRHWACGEVRDALDRQGAPSAGNALPPARPRRYHAAFGNWIDEDLGPHLEGLVRGSGGAPQPLPHAPRRRKGVHPEVAPRPRPAADGRQRGQPLIAPRDQGRMPNLFAILIALAAAPSQPAAATSAPAAATPRRPLAGQARADPDLAPVRACGREL